ncbi:kinase-like domain-containing protein [Cytidiella melzeri]|nr:kinase-like domain-containing protein [Cytidiella melzeri]
MEMAAPNGLVATGQADRSDLQKLCGVFEATDGSATHFAIPHRTKEFTIGRDLQCDQPLLGRDIISRMHSSVRSVLSEDGRHFFVFLKDLSKNGCLVNGIRIHKATDHRVNSGDTVTFGDDDGPTFKFTQYDPQSLRSQYLLSGTELGRGTFGAVVLAHNRTSGVPVAVKVIKVGGDETPREERLRRQALIRREVRVMERLQHPYIVKLQTTIIEDQTVCLVMELAPFGNLGKLIRDRKRLSDLCENVVSVLRARSLLRLSSSLVPGCATKLSAKTGLHCAFIFDFGQPAD